MTDITVIIVKKLYPISIKMHSDNNYFRYSQQVYLYFIEVAALYCASSVLWLICHFE